MTVEDHNDMQETFSMADHDDHKIQIINVPSNSKMKKAGDKSSFDPSVIPDDIASNTLNIDHGYFLSFLPQQKSKDKTFVWNLVKSCPSSSKSEQKTAISRWLNYYVFKQDCCSLPVTFRVAKVTKGYVGYISQCVCIV